MYKHLHFGACLIILFFSLFSSMAVAAVSVLIDMDPRGAAAKVRGFNTPEKTIGGVLPKGWVDNSEWNPEIGVEYAVLEDGVTSFVRYSKVSATGRAQMSFSLPKNLEGGSFRLRVRLRSRDGSSPEIGVRDAGPPYAFKWVCRPIAGPEWKDYSYDFNIDTPSQPLVVLVSQEARASLDIASFRLEKRGEEDMIRELRERYPEYGHGNLVRNSRFPLGLPAGWSIGRDISDGDGIRITAGRRIWGPSTFPALDVSGGRIELNSAPVLVPWAMEQHVASLFVRGNGEGTLKVMVGSKEYGSTGFIVAGSEWQRVSVPFFADLGEECYYVRILGSGDLHIDGLQVERGTEPSAYAPMKPMEVALGMPSGPTSAARVGFGDEKPEVTFAVTGRPVKGKGLRLLIKVVDVYGMERLLEPIPLTDKPLQEGRISYDPPEGREYGQFRIQGWVVDEGGKVLSTVGETVITRVRRPRYWGKDAPDSPFGVHTLSTTRHLEMAKAIGINWVRTHDMDYTGWSFLEPEKGDWQFKDADIKRFRKFGLKVLGMLSTAPGWATDLGRRAEGYFDSYMVPKDPEDFGNYVTRTVKRYLGVIDAWEVWNEPWCGQYLTVAYDGETGGFLRGANGPKQYAELEKVAHDKAKAVSSRLRIVGINTTGNDDPIGRTWTGDLLKEGALAACDTVSYHHYSSDLMGRPEDDSLKAWNQAIGPLEKDAAAGAARKAVWLTEGSSVSNLCEKGMYDKTVPFDNDEEIADISNRLCRYVLATRARGAEKVFLYTMHGHSSHFVKGQNEWRTLVCDDGYLHPSAAAFSAMAWLTEDTDPVGGGVLAKGVYAVIFKARDGSGSVLAVMPERIHEPYRLPGIEGCRIWDMYGNPLEAGGFMGTDLVYVQGPSDKLMATLGI